MQLFSIFLTCENTYLSSIIKKKVNKQ